MQLIHDSDDAEYISSSFTLSSPYKPFEQLLAVLPRASNKVLPASYQRLMEDPNSPIYKYYPETFEVDMNLSVSPWEGIALLPFIDEQALKTAIASIPSLEDKEEKYINTHKEPILFVYDYQKSLTKHRIKGPLGFGPIADDVVCSKYKLPSFDRFVPKLCEGAKRIIQGSPNLTAIPFATVIQKVPVKTFGMSSKYQTLVIQVMDADAPSPSPAASQASSVHLQQRYDNLALGYLQKFLSHPLYVGWPYFREAQIVEINTANFQHSVVHLRDNKTHTMSNQLAPQQRSRFQKVCHSVSQRYLTMHGVDVGDIHILVKCRLLWGMVKSGDQIVKKWSDKEELFPIQICICGTSKIQYDNIGNISTNHDGVMSVRSSVPSEHPEPDEDGKSDGKSNNDGKSNHRNGKTKCKEKERTHPLIIDDRYISRKLSHDGDRVGVGQPVMYIGPQKKYYGLCGRITSADSGSQYVDIRVLSRFQPTDFPRRVLSKHKKMNYFTLEEASHILAVDYKVLSRICAQVIVVHKPMDFDIGLNLKLFKKRLLIPGYCSVQFLKPRTDSHSHSHSHSHSNGRNRGRGRGRNRNGHGKHHGNNKKERVLVKISEKGVELIREYKEKFPEVFSVLRCKHYSKQFYPDEFSRDTMKRLLPKDQQQHQQHSQDLSGSNGNEQRKEEQRTKKKEQPKFGQNVESLGVEEVEEEEEVDMQHGQEEEEEEEVDMSSLSLSMNGTNGTKKGGSSKIDESAMSAEDYKMLMRTKRCAEGKNFLLRIHEWLQEQEVSKLPLIEFDAQFLPNSVMAALEDEADKYYKSQLSLKPKAYHLKRVPVDQVYLADPEIAWSPTERESFCVANRVSVLRSDEGIPFGTQGTVVGLHDSFLELITDTKVMKGSTLHNRCSDHRGVILPYSSVLNLTPNLKPPESVQSAHSKYERHHHQNHRHHQNGVNPNHTNHNGMAPGMMRNSHRSNKWNRSNQHPPHHIVDDHHRNGNGNKNKNGMKSHHQQKVQRHNNLMMNQSILNGNDLSMHWNQSHHGLMECGSPLSSMPSVPSNGMSGYNAMNPMMMNPMMNGMMMPNQMNLGMMSIPNQMNMMSAPNMANQMNMNGVAMPGMHGMAPLNMNGMNQLNMNQINTLNVISHSHPNQQMQQMQLLQQQQLHRPNQQMQSMQFAKKTSNI